MVWVGSLLLISGCLLWLRQTKSKFTPGSSPATVHQVRQVASVVTADKGAQWVTSDTSFFTFYSQFLQPFSWIPRVLSFSGGFILPLRWFEEPFPLMALVWPGSCLRLIQQDTRSKLIMASIKCNRATLLCQPRRQIPVSPGKQNELDLTRRVSSSQSANTEWMTPACSAHYLGAAVHSMEIWAEKRLKKKKRKKSSNWVHYNVVLCDSTNRLNKVASGGWTQ